MAEVQDDSKWINKSESSSLFVFVHGINSSSDTCWLNTKTSSYWPALVAEEGRLGHPNVFVTGYPSGPTVGKFDVYDAAEHILVALRDAGSAEPPISKPTIVFVCHSQGGIVVRKLLLTARDQFHGKRIGIAFCGSPSWGSIWANLASPIAWVLRYRQLSALKWGSSSLRDLDRDFRKLIANGKRMFQLSGVSLVEARGILPFLPPLVSEASATRFFPKHYLVAGTNHMSIVKPENTRHDSHRYLVDWFVGDFLGATPALSELKRDDAAYASVEVVLTSDYRAADGKAFRRSIAELVEIVDDGRAPNVSIVIEEHASLIREYDALVARKDLITSETQRRQELKEQMESLALIYRARSEVNVLRKTARGVSVMIEDLFCRRRVLSSREELDIALSTFLGYRAQRFPPRGEEGLWLDAIAPDGKEGFAFYLYPAEAQSLLARKKLDAQDLTVVRLGFESLTPEIAADRLVPQMVEEYVRLVDDLGKTVDRSTYFDFWNWKMGLH